MNNIGGISRIKRLRNIKSDSKFIFFVKRFWAPHSLKPEAQIVLHPI